GGAELKDLEGPEPRHGEAAAGGEDRPQQRDRIVGEEEEGPGPVGQPFGSPHEPGSSSAGQDGRAWSGVTSLSRSACRRRARPGPRRGGSRRTSSGACAPTSSSPSPPWGLRASASGPPRSPFSPRP